MKKIEKCMMFLRYVPNPCKPTPTEITKIAHDAECDKRQVYRARDRMNDQCDPLTILVKENKYFRTKLVKLYSFMVRRLSGEEPTLVDLENNEEVGKIVKESDPELYRRLMKK